MAFIVTRMRIAASGICFHTAAFAIMKIVRSGSPSQTL
jgi:hypothetical protein